MTSTEQDAGFHRVAFVVNWFPALSEVFVMNAAADLVRRGVAVDIIGAWGTGGMSGPCHDVERRLRNDPAVRIIGARHMHHRRNRALSLPSMLSALRQRRGWRVTLRVLREAARHGGTRFLAQAVALSHARYDTVHCHFATVGPLAARLKNAGIITGPLVVHFRGYDVTRFVAEQGRDVYADVFGMADWFIANCQAFADRAIALGCPADRIDVISTGLDLAAFDFRPRAAPADDTVRLLGIGRLVEKKGFALAIAALGMLRARGVDARLTLIGDGEQRGELEAQIARADLRQAVDLAGAQPHGVIADYLAQADILLAPSVTARTGDQDAPVNTLKEAMATGALVIGSRHGGIPEIVTDGVNGWLCAEDDAADLAATIIRALATRSEWPVIRRAARRTVEDHHSLDLATRQTLAVYAKARHASRAQQERLHCHDRAT